MYKFISSIFLILLFSSYCYSAQGDFTVTVVDGAFNPVPGAVVIVKKQNDPNISNFGLTDANGQIVFTVPLGETYTIQAATATQSSQTLTATAGGSYILILQ